MRITGIVHAHSTHSYDGKVPLRELRDLLIQHGLSFCCMTEHADTLTAETAAAFVAECEALSDDSFIFIPGFEVPYQNAHVLFIGTTQFFGQTADATVLQQYQQASEFVVLAHPVRNRFAVDGQLLAVMDAVEIWNQQYEGKGAPRHHSRRLLASLKRNKPSLLAIGGLDFHRREHFGTPLLNLSVDELTMPAVLGALRSGTYEFGTATVRLNAKGDLIRGTSVTIRLNSYCAIFVISAGKAANALLAHLGLTLPKSWRQWLRAKV